MPFKRRWSREERTHIIDRDLTGPVRPVPDTGTQVTEDGIVVADSSNLNIPPATPMPVTIPGIREPVLDALGSMSPRWWRFFEELYRRTGAIEDNINNANRFLSGSGTSGSIALAGVAPTAEISVTESPSTGSLSLAGVTPFAVSSSPIITPSTASLGLTGDVPVIP